MKLLSTCLKPSLVQDLALVAFSDLHYPLFFEQLCGSLSIRPADRTTHLYHPISYFHSPSTLTMSFYPFSRLLSAREWVSPSLLLLFDLQLCPSLL